MRRRFRGSSTKAEVDLTPMIDAVFLLLIFFMVTSNFQKDLKVELERPGAASATPAATQALRIAIDPSGTIYVDGNPVRPWMVQTRVREYLRGASTKSVLVVTDRRVPAEALVDVVDQCRLAGASDVGVATDKEAG